MKLVLQCLVSMCSTIGTHAMQRLDENVRAGVGNNVVPNSTPLEASYLVDESGFDSSTFEPNTQTALLTEKSDAFRKPANPHTLHPPTCSPGWLVHKRRTCFLPRFIPPKVGGPAIIRPGVLSRVFKVLCFRVFRAVL